VQPPNFRAASVGHNNFITSGICKMCVYRRTIRESSELVCLRAPHLQHVSLFDVCDDFDDWALKRPMEWFPPITLKEFNELRAGQ